MFQSFMKAAFYEAEKAFNLNEVPVGCVIVKNNQIIAKTHNLMRLNHNVTHHAEMLAIQIASQKLNSCYLNECDMYVTLEPCHMCAAAISFSRIKRLYIGALDCKSGGVYHNAKLFINATGIHFVPEIYHGFMEEECEKIMKDFFSKLRSGA